MGKINVRINGNDVELLHSLNVTEMLVERNVSGTMFVVEKTKKLCKKEIMHKLR